jgi:hypothetical protein
VFLYEFMGQVPIQTLSGLIIASGFSRIVYGGRGAYVEFRPSQLDASKLQESETKHFYYTEYFTVDSTRAKVYLQRHEVGYADYHLNMFYTSPIFLRDFVRTGKKYRMVEV